MHRGNPFLTGEVQASGLRHFQQVKWELEGDFSVDNPLVSGPDVIYVLWRTGEIGAIEKDTGRVRWQWKPGQDEVTGQDHLFLDQGVLYGRIHGVRTLPGTHQKTLQGTFLYAFDAQTGQVLRRLPVPPFGNKWNVNLFTIDQGVIYLNGTAAMASPPPSAQYACAAIDGSTGKLLWLADMGVQLHSPSPVVAHGMVYLLTIGRAVTLHALDAQTGKHLWKYESERGLPADFAVAGTDIVLSGSLEVIDALSGTRKGTLSYPGAVLTGSPTLTETVICLGSESFPTWMNGIPHQTGEIAVFDRATREPRWRVPVNEGEHMTTGTIIAGDLLYTVWSHLDVGRDSTDHATLYALDLRTGQEYWQFHATTLSAPLVTDGNVFLVREEGEEMSAFLCALA